MLNNNVLLIDVSWLYCTYAFANKDKGYKDPPIHGFCYFLKLLYDNNINDFKNIYFVIEGDRELIDKYEIYSEYKKGRSSKSEIYKNFSDFLKLISVFSKASIVFNKYKESDDTLAFLAKKHCKKDKVYIYSGDSDMWQLLGLSDNIKIVNKYKDGKFIEVTKEEVYKKYPVPLKDIIKYKTLSGDSSDNIPPPIKGLRSTVKQEVVKLWEEDEYFDQNILGKLMLRVKDDKLRWKFAENCEKLLMYYKIMDLTHVDENYRMNKFIKKLSFNVTTEELNNLINIYNINFYRKVINNDCL
jgi:5'-3' exonuclease